MDMETDDIIVQSIPQGSHVCQQRYWPKKKCKLIPVPEKVNQVMKKEPPANMKYGEVQFEGETWYIGSLKPLKMPKDDDPTPKR